MADDVSKIARERPTPLLDAVLRAAAARPSAIAIACGSRRMTYAELVERAAKVAAWLRARGIGGAMGESGDRAEDVVALDLGRSPDHVVAMLGVWWAGAALLLLDPTAPAARRTLVLDDVGARVVLGVRELVEAWAASAVAPEPAPRSPEDLAYVISTSGSTGRPKGVEVLHRGLLPVLEAQVRAFCIEASSRIAWLLSPAFDASISDIGTALVAGATLVIEEPSASRSPSDLVRMLAEAEISHVDLPPALLPLLDPARLPMTLRTVVIGGEVAALDAVRRWAARVRLVNVYGPTEATICTSLGVCGVDWDRPRLGLPLPHVTYTVVADEGEGDARTQGPKAVGELWISGPALARGYRGRPELTAAKFVERSGVRFYRTGDRVRRLDDGDLEILGRIDRQLKLRGRLVEPEEIEARLRDHPAVARAAVVRDARANLVAVLVPRGDASSVAPGELCAYLGRVLPAWMVPARFDIASALPETSSGKVDVEALARVQARSGLGEMPGDADEQGDGAGELAACLAGFWARVLDVDSVGLDADLASRGADSLAVLRFVAEAEAAGVSVAPDVVAAARTVRELALRLAGPAQGAVTAEALFADASRALALANVVTTPSTMPSTSAQVVEGEPGVVFVTGATGFVGKRLVAALLATTSAEIVVLARQGRLYGAPFDASGGRVRVVQGDLCRERLGLENAAWAKLAAEVDAIVHSGAVVNMLSSYAELREANVLGTARVAALARARARAREARPKVVHHVSTLSVFVATEREGDATLACEGDDLGAASLGRVGARVYGGYAQAKFAGEIAVRRALAGVAPLVVHRLGLVTGDSRTGRGAPNDLLGMFFRGLRELGCVPDALDRQLRVDITPVDYVASALAALVKRPWRLGAGSALAAEPACLHLASEAPATLGLLLDAMEAEGLVLARVPDATFRERVATAARRGSASAAAVGLALGRGRARAAGERARGGWPGGGARRRPPSGSRSVAGGRAPRLSARWISSRPRASASRRRGLARRSIRSGFAVPSPRSRASARTCAMHVSGAQTSRP